MAQQDIWKDIFDTNPMNSIAEDLRRITSLADKQAFGMERPEQTASIRKLVVIVRKKLDEFERLLPEEHVNETQRFITSVVKLLENNKGEKTRKHT